MTTRTPAQVKAAEKALFLTLWSIIIIGISIWVFWPKASERVIPTPELELGKNVSPIFGSAFVTPTPNAEYHVTLHLLPEYLTELGKEEKELELGVRFLGDTSVIEETKVYTRLRADEPIANIVIPNPKHYHPKRLLLYLAH